MTSVVREQKSFLIALFSIALLIRACVFYGYLAKDNRYWQVDSNTYNQVAIGISQNKGIALPDGKLNFYRVPLYPIFLSLYYKLFGVDTKNVLWLQVVLAAFIPVLIFLLSLTLFPNNLMLAKIASLYSTFHIGLVLYAGFFMTETLFIFLFLLFAILFFRSLRFFERKNESIAWIPDQVGDDVACKFSNNKRLLKNQSFLSFLPDPIETSQDFVSFQELMGPSHYTRKYALDCLIETPEQKNMQRLLLAGFFLGLASLVRPVGHYLIILSCIILLCSHGYLRDKLARCYALFLGWIVPVLFWLLRNYMLLGAIFFHTLPGGHFLYLSAARVAMHVKHCSYQEARDSLKQEVNGLITEEEKIKKRDLNEIERCRVHEKLAVKYFCMRPLLSIKFWLTDMMRAGLSLYSAELLYLESGRKDIDYFKKDRTIWSMFERYLFPETSSWLLKILIVIEILFYFFILLGFVLGFVAMVRAHGEHTGAWLKTLPYMFLFILISLAGGYARMRLPIEPFLIILSFSFWVSYVQKINKRKSV